MTLKRLTSEQSEGVEDALGDATQAFGDNQSDSHRGERHLTHLEDAVEDHPHHNAAGEEREVVVDGEDHGETHAHSARCELAEGLVLLKVGPDGGNETRCQHGLESERRKRIASLRGVENHGRDCPHLADRRR